MPETWAATGLQGGHSGCKCAEPGAVSGRLPAEALPQAVRWSYVPSMTEQTLVVARRFMQTYADGDSAGLLALLTPDWVLHEEDGSMTTPELIVEITDAHREPFPDKGLDYLHELVDGELVMQHVRFTFIHARRYEDLEPTGKIVHLSEMIVHRMQEGLIAESWRMTYPDGLYDQLSDKSWRPGAS
jgi:ketosteroid isomerase-like protein